MTAISFTTTPAPAAFPAAFTPQRTRLRLTLRGRRVLAGFAAAPVILALGAAMIGGGAAMASRDAGAAPGTFETVVVSTGDSLWSIAEEVAPAADPRDVVDAIVRLNALDSPSLQSGQSLAIPAEYSAAS